MTRSELTSLSLKLAAVYVWVDALLYASYLAVFGWRGDAQSSFGQFAVLSVLVPAILLAVLGVLLFFLGARLAQRSPHSASSAELGDAGPWGAIGLRIAAIVLWMRAIRVTSAILPMLSVGFSAGASGEGPRLAAQIVTLAVLAGAGAWLFFRADALARRWFAARSTSTDGGTTAMLQAIAFSVAGVCILGDALPDLLVFIALIVQRSRSDELSGVSMVVGGIDWASTLVLALRVTFGLLLFLNREGLAASWHWIRRAGLAAQRAGLDSKGKSA